MLIILANISGSGAFFGQFLPGLIARPQKNARQRANKVNILKLLVFRTKKDSSSD